MSVTIELTYELSKVLGLRRFAVEADSVAEALAQARARFGGQAEAYDRLTRVAALAVNGVLIQYQAGLRTPLGEGDTLTFVKAAAGG